MAEDDFIQSSIQLSYGLSDFAEILHAGALWCPRDAWLRFTVQVVVPLKMLRLPIMLVCDLVLLAKNCGSVPVFCEGGGTAPFGLPLATALSVSH